MLTKFVNKTLGERTKRIKKQEMEMINMFSQKNRNHADKYRNLIKTLKLNEEKSIKDNLIRLDGFKKDLNNYSFNDLRLMRVEVNTLVEEHKQSSLFTSIISTTLAVITIFINFFRDFNNMLLIIFFVPVILISILWMTLDFSKRSNDFFQLLNMIDLVIKEKEEKNQLYEEAYKENMRFINEKASIT